MQFGYAIGILLLALAAGEPSAQTIYRCIEGGTTTYSSSPCINGPSKELYISPPTEEQRPRAGATEPPASADPIPYSRVPKPLPRLEDTLPVNAAGATERGASEAPRGCQGVQCQSPLEKGLLWGLTAACFVLAYWVIRGIFRALSRGAKVVRDAATAVAPQAKDAVSRTRAASTQIASATSARARDFMAPTRACPHCAELVKAAATVCKHCQKSIQ